MITLMKDIELKVASNSPLNAEEARDLYSAYVRRGIFSQAIAEKLQLASIMRSLMREALEDCSRYFDHASKNNLLPEGAVKAMTKVTAALSPQQGDIEKVITEHGDRIKKVVSWLRGECSQTYRGVYEYSEGQKTEPEVVANILEGK